MAYDYYAMTEECASSISKWTYEEPYAIYSMDGNEECISELMNGDYFSVWNKEGLLIGFICIGNSARVAGGFKAGIYKSSKYVDIGLGLRPELTGKGIGTDFLTSGILFIKEQFQTLHYQLVVAAFNARAIKVYERVGFSRGATFKSQVKEQEIDFTVMHYSLAE